MLVKILTCLIFLLSFSIYAEEALCTITSDIDSTRAVLTYELDPSTKTITHLYQETYENDRMTNRFEMDLNKITNGGIVFLERSNYDIVRIWSDNFDHDLGGVLYLDTLYSGVSGERRQYELDLAKKGAGLVVSHNKADFKSMKIIAKRSKIFGIIGIDKILFSN